VKFLNAEMSGWRLKLRSCFVSTSRISATHRAERPPPRGIYPRSCRPEVSLFALQLHSCLADLWTQPWLGVWQESQNETMWFLLLWIKHVLVCSTNLLLSSLMFVFC